MKTLVIIPKGRKTVKKLLEENEHSEHKVIVVTPDIDGRYKGDLASLIQKGLNISETMYTNVIYGNDEKKVNTKETYLKLRSLNKANRKDFTFKDL